MFSNFLMTGLMPLRNTDELKSWDNQPFTKNWPEDYEKQKKEDPVKKTILKKKTKRRRTAYTTNQITTLENIFNKNKFIDSQMRQKLASDFNVGDKSIKIWFQNRRMKEKRQSSESDTYSDSSSVSTPPTQVPTTDAISNLQNNQNSEIIPFPASENIHNAVNFNESLNINEIKPNHDYMPNNINYSVNHFNYFNETYEPSHAYQNIDYNTYSTEYYPVQDYSEYPDVPQNQQNEVFINEENNQWYYNYNYYY